MTHEQIDSILERMCYEYCVFFTLPQLLKDDVCNTCPLNELREEMMKWIPVSERLPEKYQYVLVTYNGLDGRRLVVVTNWNPNTWIESNSVAWMPVPEPYKEG